MSHGEMYSHENILTSFLGLQEVVVIVLWLYISYFSHSNNESGL